MAFSRHLARVIVLQSLFAYEFHGGNPETILGQVSDDVGNKNPDLEFARGLMRGIISKTGEIHELIIHYAPQWPIDKIAPIDRAALEIGIFEMKYSKDVPDVVAIDEAIELAKSFGNENSPKFINGVLNAILEETRHPGGA